MADAEILHTKYLDWCSARVAARLLEFDARKWEEMTVRAEEATGNRTPAPDPEVPELGFSGFLGQGPLTETVRWVILTVFRELGLPRYEVWMDAYRSDPERFEQEILGFARSGERLASAGGGRS